MVSAILTGVFDLAPTKLYKVGTMQDIPKPTSMKPKELIITFMAIDPKTPPNRAETKKTDTDKAARQLQDFLLSPKLISVVSQETARCHHNHKYKKTDLQ